MEFTLLACGMRAVPREVAVNAARLKRLFKRECRENSPGVLALFPEMCVSGYVKDADWLLANRGLIEGAVDELARSTAESPGNILVFGAPGYTDDGRPMISQYVCADGGIAGRHDKIVLSSSEVAVFVPGGHPPKIFDVHGLRLGITICYETHFPDLAAALADARVDVILAPFASPMETAAEKIARWRRYLPARAYDNSCYLLACNLVWDLPSGKTSPGAAMVIDPKGRELASRASKNESVCRAQFDTNTLEKIRKSPDAYFAARRNWRES